MTTGTKSVIVQGEIWLFEIPFILEGIYKTSNDDSVVSFSVRVANKTLGDVLRYLLGVLDGPSLRLDPPWNAIERVRLDSFAFVMEIRNGASSYGFTYTDLGIDLGFAQFDKLGVLFTPKSKATPNRSLNVNVFGTFLGVSFADKPISWDALKEQPPQTPAASEKVFKLDYLGLGQRVTLNDIDNLKTISAIMARLRKSYEPIPENALNPLGGQSVLVYDESAAWLVGASFSVLETFDFQGLWNLPALAGARIALRGERAKSLAGLEFEILYRKIAEDLGQYHIELVLPDVLRRFQAGAASVTLPIIEVEIYTDGGFKIDLGFPTNLNFERSFSIEIMVSFVPVTGAIGSYFGRLSPLAVPGLPAIIGGNFGPVIIAGVGFRLGVGKSITAGILKAGFFLGIEGLIEGVLGFYEPFEESEPKAVYFRCTGTLQLTGHIYGEVSFAIISAAVDIYAYIQVQATFEVYRATVLAFEAGVRVKLTVKINLGLFSISIKLSFSATIRQEALIGQDEATPWQIAAEVGTMLKEQLGPVAYRRLPTGEVVANDIFARILDTGFDRASALTDRAGEDWPEILLQPEKPDELKLYFRPITALGIEGDHPGGTPDPAKSKVNLIAALMLRLTREGEEVLSPAEIFAELVLRWGLREVRELTWLAGAELVEPDVTMSELRYLQEHLEGAKPPIVVTPGDVLEFFTKWAAPVIEAAPWTDTGPDLTPFPMIPFLTLKTGEGETQTHSFDFETRPLCSAIYQQEVRTYFDNLNPMRDSEGTKAEAVLGVDGEELSMTQLIFIDCFKLVLRMVVSEAIELLTLLDVEAGGRSLEQIALDCGMGHPAGVKRIFAANLDNPDFFAVDSSLTVAVDGVQLAKARNLEALARKLDLPTLTVARAIYTQPILDPAATVALDGVRHLITASDTKRSIRETYGIENWQDVLDANPFFDWRVPKKVKDPHYPTLELPAGSWLVLPPITVPAKPTCALADIADAYKISVAKFTGEPSQIVFAAEGLALQGLSVTVRDGETIRMLATRVGLVTPEQVARNMLFDPLVLATGAPITIPAGQHIIARGDTLESIANEHQTSAKAIEAANKAEPWRLFPRPNSDEKLPMGVQIDLPTVAEYLPGPDETFVTIAQRFGLEPLALALHNADNFVLPPLAEVLLPPMALPAVETPRTAAAAAQPFGIAPDGLVRANQGSTGGQGASAPLGTVRIPDCEKIAEAALISRLANATDGSRLAGASQAQARFIMAGLRLPDPESAAAAGEPISDKLLWPLYTLSGQQWAAPDTPGENYWVELSWNASKPSQRMATAILPIVPPPVKVQLTTADVSLINQFRSVSATPADIQPKLLSRSAYPAFQQLRVERTLGAATPWSVPERISFDEDVTSETVDAPLLLEIPAGLRAMLPYDNRNLAALEVSQTSPDPISGQPVRRALKDIGWATRIDLQLRQVFGSEQDGEPLNATYEAVSIAAQGQADLEGLRAYIHDYHDGKPVDLYLLYPTDPLGPVPNTLRTDAIKSEDRAKVALLKSNLSTFSNPAAVFGKVALLAAGDPSSAVTLDQGRAFLDLLWQISVTNGGGFFLNYPDGPDGPGFPGSLFDSGASATVTILAVLRSEDGQASTPAPARCHNVLVTAENLASADATVQVLASEQIVKIVPGSDPAVTEALQTIAGVVGISAVELARLNQSNHTILQAGVTITVAEHDPYPVKPGDDLLGIKTTLDIEFDTLVDAIVLQTGLLVDGAVLAVRPGWVTAKSSVEPEQGGFNVLRSQPVEPAKIVTPADETADIQYRIQSLFQMMGYALDEGDGFAASHHGLAIFPNEPDKDQPTACYGMEGDTSQPWVYRRLLPLAPFAEPGRFDHIDFIDPYGGLGRKAHVSFGFQDVFGNRLPRATASEAVDWAQLYRDPLVPLHAWPSVTLSYDVAYARTQNSPQIRIRVKFAPAGYVATIGVTAQQLRKRVEADQRRYGLIYYQVADERVDAEAITTMTQGIGSPVDSNRMAEFAADAYGYLAAVRVLQPRRVPLTDETTIRAMAGEAAVTPVDMARHLARQPRVLRTGAVLYVPESLTVLPNSSLEQIYESTPGCPPPDKIGELNARVLLARGIVLDLAGEKYKTKPKDTLDKITPAGSTVGQVATDNADVRGLFREGTELVLGVRHVEIGKDQMLGQIADREAVTLDNLAQANAKRPIFANDKMAELPLHLRIPPGTQSTAAVEEGQSLADFVKAHSGSIRDILTANSATTELLRPGEKIVFRKGDAKPKHETVGEADTLATVTLRLAMQVKDPSLKPADVGAFASNAGNPDLLLPGALMLLPPIRFGKDVDVPHSASRKVSIDRLGVEIRICRRHEEALIDPAFRDVLEVKSATSTVPARLSSEFSMKERATLRAFAIQFQKTFDNLKLCVGPDTFSSVSPRALLAEKAEPESKLVAVHWGNTGFFAEVSGPPVFFAPRPLRNQPWIRAEVPILPYTPGQPLDPDGKGIPTLTNFNGVDLERWASTLLSRIDRILKPDLAVPLRALAPDRFQTITNAKAAIADAVSKRVALVLDGPVDDQDKNRPDQASAAEQFKQQLLVELGNTYRGGVVIQYDVAAGSPESGNWTPETAPRLLCALAQILRKVPKEDPTLLGLAKELGADSKSLLVAELIEHVENLLSPGFIVPLGEKPKVEAGDTIASVLKKCGDGVTLRELVDMVENDVGFLKPGADVPIARRETTTEIDETIGSALERLAPNLTAGDMLKQALRTFLDLNGKMPGVFVSGIPLEWKGSPPHTTTETDTFLSVANDLKADPVALYEEYLVAAPLLAPQTEFFFLARVPPVAVSASKITLFSGQPNKMNSVLVNSAPDDASSLPIQLRFRAQAMEYNIHDVVDGAGYRGSEWLTFVDCDFGATLESVSVPVANRQFPLPPQILSHDVTPQVKDGQVAPAKIEKIMVYDYKLKFAFDAAPQDEISYTRYEDNAFRALTEAGDSPAPGEALAYHLAQYQAIDESLWADIFTLRCWEIEPPGDAQREIVRNAVSILADLADKAATAWPDWSDEGRERAKGERFRIRRHVHPSGRAMLTVTPESGIERAAGRSLPQVRILGRKHRNVAAGLLSATALESPRPVPRTRRGEFYEVLDPDLNLLEYQRCWGGISVMRNRRLVSGTDTSPDFILHVPDVRTVSYLTPSFTYSQRIDLGTEIGPLKDRLKKVIERIYFPETGSPVPAHQRMSATVTYTRPLATANTQVDAEPADWRALFVPVATTPLLELDKEGAEGRPTPEVLATQLASHLGDVVSSQNLAPSERWSFTLKLFSHFDDKDSPPQLLEIIDIRMRMSDHSPTEKTGARS